MLCSNCNKNTAVVFINKTENGQTTTEGLCYNCAKKRGINPLDVIVKNANLTPDELDDMSNQFEEILQDFSGNLDIENLSPDDLNNENNPLGGFFSMFKTGFNNQAKSASENSEGSDNVNNSSPKKASVKVSKKQKSNKKK